MNDICATVMIMTDNGPVRINESDYDPNVHTLAPDQTVASVQADLTAYAGGEAPGGVTVIEGEVLPPVVENDPSVVNHASPASVVNAAPVILLVFKDGKKYFIVDMTGKKVVGDGIDEKGYASEDAAFAVISGLTDEQKSTVKAA